MIPSLSPLESILLAIVPGLAQLIATALADNYDQEAEKQALLNMARALADKRVELALAKAP